MNYLIQHYLRDAAERNPDAAAVVDRQQTITYGELESKSGLWAQLFRELGVKEGDRIGLYLDKSIDAVTAIYGTLKARCVYVPFDPRAPEARLGYIAKDCGVRLLFSSVGKAGHWSDIMAVGAPIETIVVPEELGEDLYDLPGVRVESTVRASIDGDYAADGIDTDLAYILYTSGSTGAPKGVMLSHRNAMVFVDWAVQEFNVEATDRLSSHAPFQFDLSVFDLFAAAKAGAPVILVPYEASFFPGEVARFIRENEISVWYSVPSILSMLTERGGLAVGDLSSLRLILFAGEVFPTKYLSRLMTLLPHVEFCNLYGPTETNVCTNYRVSERLAPTDPPISIGKSIANVETFVLTDQGRLAEVGEAGELYVRGGTVMAGYWGDPSKTSERLVANPLGEEAGDTAYKTGDLVEEQPDGNYRLLGRRDSQIKSRGYRIELGEIESALYAHPAVEECGVVAIPDELVTNRLKAFVVLNEDIAVQDLIRFCQERIPRYMIPEGFEVRQDLPKTSTGKIDRQLLAAQAS